MNIHIKRINGNIVEHERTEDAPFIGALVCASSCNKKCKGCINKDMKKEPTIEYSLSDLLGEVKLNPFNEGIILGGLEWSDTPLELLDIVRQADGVGLSVMIYTGYTIEEFWARIGKAVYSSTMASGLDAIIGENDGEFFGLIGKIALDEAIKHTYWIKAGEYQRDFPSPENVQFDVRLASGNQKIYQINEEEE